MTRTTPPFRADHVGSLLRTREVLQARDDREHGRDERTPVPWFYSGNQFLYRYLKLLTAQ